MMKVCHDFNLHGQREDIEIQRDRELAQVHPLQRRRVFQTGNDLACEDDIHNKHCTEHVAREGGSSLREPTDELVLLGWFWRASPRQVGRVWTGMEPWRLFVLTEQMT